MKFVHTADRQFRKAFEHFDRGVRAALTEARFDAIDTISSGQIRGSSMTSWSIPTTRGLI